MLALLLLLVLLVVLVLLVLVLFLLEALPNQPVQLAWAQVPLLDVKKTKLGLETRESSRKNELHGPVGVCCGWWKW